MAVRPPRDEACSAQADHCAQRGHEPQQHAAPPRRGEPFQPAKIIDRGPPGLRRRDLEGRDLLEVMIKKGRRAMPDDAHRVGEAIGGVGLVQHSSSSRRRTKCGTRYASHAIAMAAKITPVVPTPRRYGAEPRSQVILSGVSQETDVTDVAQHLTGRSKVETNAASTRQNPPADLGDQRWRRFSQRCIRPSGTSSAFSAKTR